MVVGGIGANCAVLGTQATGICLLEVYEKLRARGQVTGFRGKLLQAGYAGSFMAQGTLLGGLTLAVAGLSVAYFDFGAGLVERAIKNK